MLGGTTVCPSCGRTVPVDPTSVPPPRSATGVSSATAIVLIVVAVGGVGAVILGLAAVAVVGFFVLSTSSVVATTMSAPVPTAPALSPELWPESVPVAELQSQANVVSSEETGSPSVEPTGWYPLPENPDRVSLKFPALPALFDPLEGAGLSADEQALASEIAADLFGAGDAANFRATVGETTYSYSALPFDLPGIPTDAYLNQVGTMIETTQPGFTKRSEKRLTLEAPESLALPQSVFPAYQATLESADAKRFVRIVPIGQELVSLSVEGPKGMADDDPTAIAFLDGLGLQGEPFDVSVAEPGASAMETVKLDPTTIMPGADASADAIRSLPASPAIDEWTTFRGEQIAFEIDLPAKDVLRLDIGSAFATPGDKAAIVRAEALTAAISLARKHELFVVQQIDRRFIVIAVEAYPEGEWYDTAGKVSAVLDPWTAALYPSPGVSYSLVRTDEAAPKGTAKEVYEVRGAPKGRAATYLRRVVGQYGFLILYENDAPILGAPNIADDPIATKLFDSLVVPDDAMLP